MSPPEKIELKVLFAPLVLALWAWGAFAADPSLKDFDRAQAAALERAHQITLGFQTAESVFVPIPLAGGKSYDAVATKRFKNCLDRAGKELKGDQDQDSYHQIMADYLNGSGGIYAYVPALHLDFDDIEAVTAYVEHDYFKPINSALWKHHPGDTQCVIDKLKTALQKFPELKGMCVRGTKIPPDELKRYKSGAVVSFPGFTSATVGEDLTENFRDQPYVLRIKSIHGRDISVINDEEGEVIFLPGTRIRVLKKPFENSELGAVEIDLEEVP